jgi:hypothetical protein
LIHPWLNNTKLPAKNRKTSRREKSYISVR